MRCADINLPTGGPRSPAAYACCPEFCQYDQVTIIEADTLEEIHHAAVDFRIGAKGKYIMVLLRYKDHRRA